MVCCTPKNLSEPSAISEENLSGVLLPKGEALKQFAEIFSRAVSENEHVRSFMKTEALKRVDNGADVLYELVKDTKVQGKAFKDILKEYSSNPEQLSAIERSIPLLNIHIPEMGNVTVESMDTSDPEIPILIGNVLYLNGKVVDTLGMDEFPGFHTMVVCENSRVRPVTGKTRAGVKDLLGGKFEFIDEAFNPAYNTPRTITRAEDPDYDDPSEKYGEGPGYLSKGEIDPLVLDACKNAKNSLRATRYMLYYNLKDTAQMPGQCRKDIQECLWRFRIAPSAFKSLQKITEETRRSKEYLFYEEVTHKITRLSREEVLSRILTGRPFCFLFEFESSIHNNQAFTQQLRIYATPEKVFNLKLDEYRRHPTFFRHTKYTYKINFSKIKAKWFYPLENSHDTRFGSWDIAKDPLEKKVTIYLVNPYDGATTTESETYTVQYARGAEVGINASVNLSSVGKLGIEGKLNSSATVTKTVTCTRSMIAKNLKLGEFYIHYFDDYPIETLATSQDKTLPMRRGSGSIETTIIPVSNRFYIQHKN